MYKNRYIHWSVCHYSFNNEFKTDVTINIYVFIGRHVTPLFCYVMAIKSNNTTKLKI